MAKNKAAEAELEVDEQEQEDIDDSEELFEGQDVEGNEDDTEEPVAETETEEVAETEEPASDEVEQPDDEPDFLDTLRDLGFEDVKDEADARKRLLQSYQQMQRDYAEEQQRIQEMEMLARYGQQYLSEQQKQQLEQQKQQQQQEEATGTKAPWNPPALPENWERFREPQVMDNGEVVVGWKKDTPPSVITAAQEYEQYTQNWAEQLIRNPIEALKPYFEYFGNTLLDERLEALQQQQQLNQFTNQVREQNADWMYEVDPRTNQYVVDRNGSRKLTAAGEQMMGYVDQVANAGVTDPQMQWVLAVSLYDYMNKGQAQPQTRPGREAPEPPSRSERKRQHLQKSTRNRTGTVPEDFDDEETRDQNPYRSPGQQMLEEYLKEA